MSSIKLNLQTFEPILENGDFVIVDELEEVAQDITVGFLVWAGEHFLDRLKGFRHTRVLGKNLSIVRDHEIRRIITETHCVKKIVSYDFQYNDGRARVDIEIETCFGLLSQAFQLFPFGGFDDASASDLTGDGIFVTTNAGGMIVTNNGALVNI